MNYWSNASFSFRTGNTRGRPEAQIILEQNLLGIDFVFMFLMLMCVLKNLVLYVVFVYVSACVYSIYYQWGFFLWHFTESVGCVCHNLNVDSVSFFFLSIWFNKWTSVLKLTLATLHLSCLTCFPAARCQCSKCFFHSKSLKTLLTWIPDQVWGFKLKESNTGARQYADEM